jgi:hypothetical protein
MVRLVRNASSMEKRRSSGIRVAISNFSQPVQAAPDADGYWTRHPPPPPPPRVSLLEQDVRWGFHIDAIGVHLLDLGIARDVQFWDFTPERRPAWYGRGGVLNLTFLNEDDLFAYLHRFGYPDLFINHGRHGLPTLERLAGRCFRVHVAALRSRLGRTDNFGAECYLVDSEEFLDDRSMLYVPVVNTNRFFPVDCEKQRDFVYLATAYRGKRQDIVIDAVRGTDLTGHFHPVDGRTLELADTRITTSNWDELDIVELLRTSRIAVYPGDDTSNPAAMWECVATGLPIVVNEAIKGGKHLVVPGVTGELASEADFGDVMREVLANRESYAPRAHFEEHWDTVRTVEGYLAFFAKMGWDGWPCS